MKFWIVCDTHFSHDMLIEKGYRPAGYEDLIHKNLQEIVRPCDVLIHLGDVDFMNNEERSKSLYSLRYIGAQRWLVRGNHDGKGLESYLNAGWSMVCDGFYQYRYGLRIRFSHKPKPDRGDYDVNIHGHLHGVKDRYPELEYNDKQISLALEENDYKPWDLDTLIRNWKKKKEKTDGILDKKTV
jgi:calcineurin-like phosphoesterase family protein